MDDSISEDFIRQINENLGIAHKIARVYFYDAEEREDVVQEMMYQLWRTYDTFMGRSKFSTWMYRVCLNTAITFKRKSRRAVNDALSLQHYNIAEQPRDHDLEEKVQLLLQSIGTLSPVNKAIVLLYLEDLSYEEIASITGLSKANVGVRLVRIKKELEEKLVKQFKNPNNVNA